MRCSWRLSSLTYNVNGRWPSAKDVEIWLENENLENSFVVSIALQEVSHIDRLQSTWIEDITAWMSKHNFVLIKELYLASNLLLVYALYGITYFITKVETNWNRYSFFGLIGYKGTISIKLTLKNGISLVFVNSHFIHGDKNYIARIKQYQQSRGCLQFSDLQSSSNGQIIVWSGDFNSRLNYDSGFQQSLELLNANHSEGRLDQFADEYDQLRQSVKKKEAFIEFNEGEITFLPSYKILVGSNSYDPERNPAWCDRILYFTNLEPATFRRLRYSSYQAIKLSDHFPVSASFELEGIDMDIAPRQITDNDHIATELRVFWTCVFDEVPTWETYIPFVCRISIPFNFWKTDGCYRDWVGIFPTTALHYTQPIDWIYVFFCPYDSKSLKTVAEFPPLQPGYYRACYFSIKHNCVKGMSNSFCVRHVEK